jgi:hypothetical protein
MIVWGGMGPGSTVLGTGAHYDPLADSWTPAATADAPEPRRSHTAVWSGQQMILWGGQEEPASAPLELATYSNDGVFSDGFESGDTAAWAITTP